MAQVFPKNIFKEKDSLLPLLKGSFSYLLKCSQISMILKAVPWNTGRLDCCEICIFSYSQGEKRIIIWLYIYIFAVYTCTEEIQWLLWLSSVLSKLGTPLCQINHLWDNTRSIQPWPGMLLRPQGLVGLSLQMCPLVAGPLWYTEPQESWETVQAVQGYRHHISVNTREVATKKSLWSAYVQSKIWPVGNEVDPGCTWSSKDKPKYSRVVQ